MEKNDWQAPVNAGENFPAEFEEPKLADSVLQHRRRRFTLRSDQVGRWTNLRDIELPDSPIPTEFAMEEDIASAIREAEEIVDEDFLV